MFQAKVPASKRATALKRIAHFGWRSRIQAGMGWLHTFNLKRKVIGVLTNRRGTPQTTAELAMQANASETEVEQLLKEMESKSFVLSSKVRGLQAFQLNEAQAAIGKLTSALTAAEQTDTEMTLLQDEHGWTAELSDPAGLLVRGETRQQAIERGRAVMQRMEVLSGAPTSKPSS